MNTCRSDFLITIGPCALRSACSRRYLSVRSYGLSWSGGRSRSRFRCSSAIVVPPFLCPAAQRLERVVDGRRRRLGEAGALDCEALGAVAELPQPGAREPVRQGNQCVDDGIDVALALDASGAQGDPQ